MRTLNLETMQVMVGNYETLDSFAMTEYMFKLKEVYPKIYLILDQEPYNTNFITQQAVQEHRIILHYFLPYSLNLNPLERLCKVMNTYKNHFFTSLKEFCQEIIRFFHLTCHQIAWDITDHINDNFQRLKASPST
jgi:transposase